jgi:hypothetical protein
LFSRTSCKKHIYPNAGLTVPTGLPGITGVGSAGFTFGAMLGAAGTCGVCLSAGFAAVAEAGLAFVPGLAVVAGLVLTGAAGFVAPGFVTAC